MCMTADSVYVCVCVCVCVSLRLGADRMRKYVCTENIHRHDRTQVHIHCNSISVIFNL